ncbi:protein lin-37 homolog [Rhopilema esculentum]|uniref:protein lin-37 homolog n=1 Tax=Rhopilema esculentum TaxID=499914 RepID=UPI0031D3530D
MAQFKRDTSMYVMCRSWALNKPSATYELGTSGKKETELNEFQNLYSTPKHKTKIYGEKQSSLFTKPTHPAEHLDKVMDAVRDVTILQRDNVNRWRKVREGWRQASFETQQKHMASLRHLKSLFTQP